MLVETSRDNRLAEAAGISLEAFAVLECEGRTLGSALLGRRNWAQCVGTVNPNLVFAGLTSPSVEALMLAWNVDRGAVLAEIRARFEGLRSASEAVVIEGPSAETGVYAPLLAVADVVIVPLMRGLFEPNVGGFLQRLHTVVNTRAVGECRARFWVVCAESVGDPSLMARLLGVPDARVFGGISTLQPTP